MVTSTMPAAAAGVVAMMLVGDTTMKLVAKSVRIERHWRSRTLFPRP